jgi:hypothetical protein
MLYMDACYYVEHGGVCAPQPWRPYGHEDFMALRTMCGLGRHVLWGSGCLRDLCIPRIASLPFKQRLIPFPWCDIYALGERVLL